MKIAVNIKQKDLNSLLEENNSFITSLVIDMEEDLNVDYSVYKKLSKGYNLFFEISNVKQVELIDKVPHTGIKLKYPDILNNKLLQKLEFYQGDIIISLYGTSILDIRYSLDTIEKYKQKSSLHLCYGTLEEKQDLSDYFESVDISKLTNIKNYFGDFQTVLSINTVNYSVLKNLVTTFTAYNKQLPEMIEIKFNKIVNYLNSTDFSNINFQNNQNLNFLKKEFEYRKNNTKHWIVNVDIKKGELLDKTKIDYIYNDNELHPIKYLNVLNKPIVRDLKKGDFVTNECFENKVLAIITARSDSTRLPNKAVKEINEKPALVHLFERLKISFEKGYIDTIAFCTTIKESDDKLVEIAKDYPVKIYRGSENDVLGRMILAVDDNQDCNISLRITGDDLLIDPFYLNETIKYHLKTNADYTDAKKIPSGTEVEVFNSVILKLISELSVDRSGSEYVTNYIMDNQDYFHLSSLPVPKKHDNRLRLTLDTYDDYQVIRSLLEHMKKIGKEYTYDVDDIFNFYHENKETVFKINSKIIQKSAPPTCNTLIDWRAITKKPLVTVYITNYNYDKYIQESIESVLNQKFRDFELIIIDDGSTDKSKNIIEKYKNNPKVKIVYQHNKGLNVTNNIALKLSNGKYLMRLDADDYLDDNALLLMVEKLKNSDIALVFPDYYVVNKDGEITEQVQRHDFEKDVTLFDQPAHGACTMIKKEVLQEVNGYCEEFRCQDGYELWVKIINQYKVANINLPLFYYRQHGENLTSNDYKILSTRNAIIKKYVEMDEIKKHKHICIIPIRGEILNGNILCLKRFSNTNLIDILLNKVKECEYYSDIVITTSNQDILSYLEGLNLSNIIIDKRPEKLSAVNTYLEDTIDYLENKYKDIFSKVETVSLINYEYPLRESFYFDKAINTLYLYNVDSVISVKESSSNYYIHSGKSLEILKENKTLRLERETVYEEIGGIHCFKLDSYKQNRKINTGRIGHIILDELSVKKIRSDYDFHYLEYVFKEKNESF